MAAAAPVFLGLSMAGTALGAAGQIQAGNAAQQAAYENAQIAELNAQQADLSTADQLGQLKRQTGITFGKQQAGYGKAGVRQSGSVLETLTETLLLADKDAYRIQQAGRFQRQGYLAQATNLRNQGDVAKKSSQIGAASTLLTGWGSAGLATWMGKGGLATQTQSQTLGGTPTVVTPATTGATG